MWNKELFAYDPLRVMPKTVILAVVLIVLNLIIFSLLPATIYACICLLSSALCLAYYNDKQLKK